MTDKVKTILGLDLEGINANLLEEGVNVKTDRVIEIGAVLWDCNFNQPVKFLSELTDESDRLSISEEVEELTGINDEMLKQWGHPADKIPAVLDQLTELINKSDAVMAHNGSMYDKPMILAMYKRFNKEFPDKPWIDSALHIEFTKRIPAKSMPVLEHAHGFINPFPHRAVTDVMAMFKIASNYSFQRMYNLAISPVIQLIAVLDAPNWRDQKEVEEFNRIKHRVSKSRFRWQPDIKKWIKEIPKILVDEGKVNYEFDYYIKEL